MLVTPLYHVQHGTDWAFNSNNTHDSEKRLNKYTRVEYKRRKYFDFGFIVDRWELLNMAMSFVKRSNTLQIMVFNDELF